jgi:hypothetical protein
MEDIPLDVVKDTLLLLDLGDLLHICQSNVSLYNICQSDEFWFQYIISKHQGIPVNVIRTLRNEHTGYKQIAIELDNGIVVPVVDSNSDLIGYKIVNYNKSFNDNFFQMIINASNTGNYITLKGVDWMIYTPLRYAEPNYLDNPGRIVSKYQPTDVYSMPVISPEVASGYSRFGIPKDIPMKNISKERFDIENLQFVQILP